MNLSRISTSIGISLKRRFRLATSLLRLVMKAWMWCPSLSYQSALQVQNMHEPETWDGHCGHGSRVFGSPRRGCAPRQLMKVIQESVTSYGGWPGSGPEPCASRKRTSSSCSIVYPAKILTILQANECESNMKGLYLQLHRPFN
jgi:hypothetical protein